MGHVSVEHLKSESKDGSRHCQQEADSIANWLADNFKKIKEVYIDTDKDLAKMKEIRKNTQKLSKKLLGMQYLSSLLSNNKHMMLRLPCKIKHKRVK